jgi:PAS domain S-box-containing protein
VVSFPKRAWVAESDLITSNMSEAFSHEWLAEKRVNPEIFPLQGRLAAETGSPAVGGENSLKPVKSRLAFSVRSRHLFFKHILPAAGPAREPGQGPRGRAAWERGPRRSGFNRMKTDRRETRTAVESAQEAAPVLPSYWNWRRFFPVGILMALGIAFFITFFFLVRGYEKERREELFQRVALTRTEAFKRRIQSDQEALLSIGHFYAASRAVEALQFRAFVQGPLQWHPEIESLEWIVRVPEAERPAFEARYGLSILESDPERRSIPAGARENYYPIHFHESIVAAPDPAAVGRDLGADPVNRAAMETALRAADGRLVASRRFFATPGAGTNADAIRVRIFLPIYTNSPNRNAPGYLPENLMGFAAMVLRPSIILSRSQTLAAGEKLELTLMDLSAPPDSALLGFESWNQKSATPSSWKKALAGEDTMSEKMALADSRWALICTPAQVYSSRMDWESWSVLLGGLLLTGLLSSYLYTLLGQAAYVENVVTRRTRELASMNVRLQNEIGERERGERALRDSEALYHSLVDTLPINILRKNLRGQITFGNRRYCESMCLPLEKMLGKTDFDLFPKELAEKYVADDTKVIETGQVFEDVEAHRKPDGALVHMHVLKAPVLDALGRVVGTQVIFWDVTERKLAEDALKHTLEDLARSNRDLEQFAYVASHDLQEPLRMIASYTELLHKRYQDKLDGEAAEFIGYAVEGAVRMQLLINDLLAYSRLGTRGGPFAATDCEHAFQSALINLQISIDESCALITHDPLPTVLGDGVQLTQLFQNLLSNAIKFRGTASPQVHVSTRRKGHDWEFSVRDNGMGLDPKFAERIFVIFQRLHQRDKFAGTGIGLAICKKIVERHGGQIWVESNPGIGSTFYFTLPVLEERGSGPFRPAPAQDPEANGRRNASTGPTLSS